MMRGTFTAEIISPVNGATCIVDIVVVNGDGRSLLGKTTAEKLASFHVGPETTCAVSDNLDIKTRFPQLFSGVGKTERL